MITYRIPPTDVSAEAFDQEVLAINLKSGHYHSLREAAVPLWNLLTSGHSIESAATALSNATGTPLDSVLADARPFVDSLLSHGLLVAVESSGPPSASTVPSNRYVPPVLEHYSDMQELLLIDPVHEVAVSGWPHQPETGPSTPAK
jgi:Coenzyme PQQ synthesis protein D (PqqD)